MDKTAIQIQAFLSTITYKSPQEHELISKLAHTGNSIRLSQTYQTDPDKGIDASDYLLWMKQGYAPGEIAKTKESYVVCGNCTLNEINTVANITGGNVSVKKSLHHPSELTKCTEDEVTAIEHILFSNSLQYSYREGSIMPKYEPKPGERVIFTNHSKRGLGVVCGLDRATGEVSLSCYHIYETKETKYGKKLTGVCDLKSCVFEPMDNGDKRHSSLNGIACRRKLEQELNKLGKSWNEKLHRLEPIDSKAVKGGRYWMLNDKFSVISAVDKGSIVDKRRYYAGNYYINEEDAQEASRIVKKALGDFMASDKCKGQKK